MCRQLFEWKCTRPRCAVAAHSVVMDSQNAMAERDRRSSTWIPELRVYNLRISKCLACVYDCLSGVSVSNCGCVDIDRELLGYTHCEHSWDLNTAHQELSPRLWQYISAPHTGLSRRTHEFDFQWWVFIWAGDGVAVRFKSFLHSPK